MIDLKLKCKNTDDDEVRIIEYVNFPVNLGFNCQCGWGHFIKTFTEESKTMKRKCKYCGLIVEARVKVL